MGFRILGTGRALPSKCLSNDDLAAFLDTSDEWIVSHTGIKSRYVCTEETLTDLSVSAAQAALANSGVSAGEIDMILYSTCTGDFLVPSMACCVSERLGTSCPAFDINAACTGFVYGLDVAAAYLQAKKANRILFISGDMLTRVTNWQDRSTCVLFGDGVGAAVLTQGESLKYIRLTAKGNSKILYVNGSPANNPLRPAGDLAGKIGNVVMDGQEVFRFAVQTVEKEVKLALDSLGLTPRDIQFFLLHQANKRIIESARIRLKQPESKFPINIDRYSNTTAATIPILLHELLEEGRVKPGDKLLMLAFGAGLTTGTCLIEWQ